MATFLIDTFQDSWINSDAPSTNYGSDSILNTKWINSPYSEYRALIKFDKDAIIAGIEGGTVTQVDLYIYAKNFGGSSDSFKVKRCNNFTESTVTWATRPSTSTTVDTTFPSTSYSWQTVDITSIYNAETSGILPIDIEAYTDGGDVRCESREFGAGHTPYLLVTYTPFSSDDIYVTLTGNDSNSGGTLASSKLTLYNGIRILNTGGNLHIGFGDFSAQTSFQIAKTMNWVFDTSGGVGTTTFPPTV